MYRPLAVPGIATETPEAPFLQEASIELTAASIVGEVLLSEVFTGVVHPDALRSDLTYRMASAKRSVTVSHWTQRSRCTWMTPATTCTTANSCLIRAAVPRPICVRRLSRPHIRDAKCRHQASPRDRNAVNRPRRFPDSPAWRVSPSHSTHVGVCYAAWQATDFGT